MTRCILLRGITVAGGILAMAGSPTSAMAANLGMVADNATHSVIVFDADTDTVLGTVALPSPNVVTGDCSITPDQTRGFVTDFTSRIHVIDLTASPPSLAGGPNPIPISNFGEDTSISPDGQFLVVCDGGVPQPISVIDIATQAEVSTFSLPSDCNSVEVCSDRSVLATSSRTGGVYRLTIDHAGTLTDTGEVLFGDWTPNNVVCAPGGTSGYVVLGFQAQIRSFTIPISPTDFSVLSGFGISGLVNPRGDRAYVRTVGNLTDKYVDVFGYDSTTGALDAIPLFTIPTIASPRFFGMDQMAIHPDGSKLYVSRPQALNVYDASNGNLLTTIQLPGASATGVCLASNRSPDCTNATASPATLWPPDHELTLVGITGVTDPDGDPVTVTATSVFQNEPLQGSSADAGPTAPDATLSPLQLRAERNGNPKTPGNGRIYHVSFMADDGKGGTCTGTVRVCVPHDQRASSTCVDGGPLYNSLTP